MDEDRAAYRDFVERLVDNAIATARANDEEVTTGTLSRHVEQSWDSVLVDEMIQTRIVEITTPGWSRPQLRGKRGWAR